MEYQGKQFRKRNAILSCLCGTDQHPSADWIFAQLKPAFPDLSLGTVYRNLAMFKQQGLIGSIGPVNGVERFDGNSRPHGHFICQCCGRIQDLPALSAPEALMEAAAIHTGAEIRECRMFFYGRCPSCGTDRLTIKQEERI